MKNKVSISISIIFTILVCFQYKAFAHGDMESLSKKDLLEIQKKLVEGGYIKPNEFTYGLVNINVEDAYDKYKLIENTKSLKAGREKQATSTDTNLSNSTPANKDDSFINSFFQKISDFLTNLF